MLRQIATSCPPGGLCGGASAYWRETGLKRFNASRFEPIVLISWSKTLRQYGHKPANFDPPGRSIDTMRFRALAANSGTLVNSKGNSKGNSYTNEHYDATMSILQDAGAAATCTMMAATQGFLRASAHRSSIDTSTRCHMCAGTHVACWNQNNTPGRTTLNYHMGCTVMCRVASMLCPLPKTTPLLGCSCTTPIGQQPKSRWTRWLFTTQQQPCH
jgi:hypothetical protein